MTSGLWARVRRYYLAGLLVLAPTALTLWVAWTFFTFFDGILGGQLRARGISVFGLGFVLLNLLLLLLGWLTTNFLGKRLFLVWDGVMHRPTRRALAAPDAFASCRQELDPHRLS